MVGEELTCEIELNNNNEKFTNAFALGDDIFFDMDFVDGTTRQFRGVVEKLETKFGVFGNTLVVRGSHINSLLLDKTVIAEYTNTLISDILKDIIDDNLTGFTYNNVNATTTFLSIEWNAKPFYDCVLDLMKIAEFDCYLDKNKDFNFFQKKSKSNNDEAIVPNQTLIEIRHFGQEAADVKNKIIVYGKNNVVYTAQDTDSQSTYGVKEKIITDESVENESQAKSLADAELALLKYPPFKGEISAFFMPKLNPGDKVWVVNQPAGIQDEYRLVKYVFNVPNVTMDLFFTEEKSIPQIIKDRIIKDTQQETITNPFKMEYSIVFPFNDLSGLSSTTNVEIFNGNLRLTSGSSTGGIISNPTTTPITVAKVHLVVKGEQLSGTTYSISADGTDNYISVTPNTETSIPTAQQGTRLKIKVDLTSSTTLLDNLTLLYK